LETLALRDTRGALMAQNVLSLVYGIRYENIMHTPSFENSTNNKSAKHREARFAVFPNPAIDWFVTDFALENDENPEDVKIELYDTKNNIVKQLKVSNSEEQILSECSDLKTGDYYLKKTVFGIVKEEIRLRIGSETAPDDKILFTMSVYPNPGSENITVEWQTQAKSCEDIRLTISDASGRIVSTETLTGKSGNQKLNTNGLGKGVYTLTATCGNKLLKTEKLVIE
jgi:hypothetical protein